MNHFPVYGNMFMYLISLCMCFNLNDLAHIYIVTTHVHILDLNM